MTRFALAAGLIALGVSGGGLAQSAQAPAAGQSATAPGAGQPAIVPGAGQPATAPGAGQAGAPVVGCPEMATALTALMRNDARLADWPNLARYREANRVLPPPSGASRVVFMGDSITDSWQNPRYGGFFPGKPYVDRGISGQTTPQMLLRFRRDVLDLQPKAVVILAGTNDIAGNTGPMTNEDIQGNLTSMSELAGVNNIRVVLASITPVSAYHVGPTRPVPQTALRPMARITALNDWMKSYAAAKGHVYLDYFTAMVDETGLMRADLTEDDLHPNAKGYAIMGPLAEAAIARALK
jgi:lysophospholipase L1-like esterase